MAKIYIMQGLPGSGKSTRAEEIVRSTGNTVRLNRDLLRTMLHFDKWTGINEGHTKDAQRKIADWFLTQGINVIVDDTNLNEGTVQSWKDFAKIHDAKVEIVRMDTSLEECLKRNENREKKVPRSVITGMAMQHGLYPTPQKGIVIFDIDGTLANIDHRLHFVKKQEGEKKDWKSFFAAMSDDTPREDVLPMLETCMWDGYDIFFVSGRPDSYREQTTAWLEKHVYPLYEKYRQTCKIGALFMRKGGDSRPDTEVKQQIYDTYFKNYNVVRVFDDRPSVIRMWRENGLEVVDVGKGVEF